MNKTTLTVGAGIILCAASILWLEGRFAASDHRKAKELVRAYRVDGRDETFEQFVVRKHGGRAGRWDSEIRETCRGIVRVQWTLDGNPPTFYQWDVELPTQEIYVVPESPGGKRLLEEFQAKPDALPPLELPPLDAGAAP
ncbi:MAG: hypothetical protein D6689_01030 [Deltaproteobacteria bacterium]|nr:MAG: hypothetical protein D6689_01030 [Deltaproteobacteria bacterium]